jgi:uncharacterized cupredoxin-like copper-binding protein
MHKPIFVAAALALPILAVTTASAFLRPVHAHEIHETFSAGKPGDPKKPSRTITVVMREMEFEPSRIEVHRGEQIRFVLQNAGTESHEFVLATTEENRKHEEVMKKFPNMEHDDPNAKRVPASARAELLWRFTKPGEFEFACLIPDHREYGMVGTVVVK